MADKKWIKIHHRIVRNILFAVLYPYSRLKYGITIEKFKGNVDGPYLILYNHQTAFDQFFVGMSVKGSVYYLASEDIFSNGFVSSIIRHLVAPIPIKKQTLDITAIKTCLRVAREGGTIAIAPEGNRTFSGKTEYINPAIASLVKKLNLPVLLFRIEGGYGVHPRWSDVVRKGKMRAYVSEVISADEVKSLGKDELFDRISRGLFVDEANADSDFNHAKRAEFLERALYVCPDCKLSSFESNGHILRCVRCSKSVEYTPSTRLKGIDFELPFSFVSDLYDYQKDFINQFDPCQHITNPLYTEKVSLSEVIVYKKKVPLKKNASISLYGNRIVIDENGEDSLQFDFDKISAVTILGKNKLNIYADGKIYQIKGEKRFNALKYVHIYNRYMNVSRGDFNGKFLGL